MQNNKIKKQLALRTETVRALVTDELRVAAGGGNKTWTDTGGIPTEAQGKVTSAACQA
jgi:hypothetical protein